mmetsp:Transcript_7964/g.17735  ORF Transcript_7964/g.17735 Transcript_7964/m.17735 type:complete len:396 (-) Transcript_7964:65-1252(-)
MAPSFQSPERRLSSSARAASVLGSAAAVALFGAGALTVPRQVSRPSYGNVAEGWAFAAQPHWRRSGLSSSSGRSKPGVGRAAVPEPGTPPLSERTFLITGGTSGIGKTVAKRLAQAGATVLVHGKQERLVKHVLKEIATDAQKDQTQQAKAEGYVADLSLLGEVHDLAEMVAEEHPVIHGILHNAASMDGNYQGKRLVTKDGHEHTMAVNVLAPFLLTARLQEALLAAPQSRVVFTGSETLYSDALHDLNFQESPWTGMKAYGLSKLCGIMLALEMHARFGHAPRQTFHAIHPGRWATKLAKHAACFATGKRKYRRWTAFHRQGLLPDARFASRSYEALTSDEFQHSSGLCDIDCPPEAMDSQARKRLWDSLVELTGAEWPVLEEEILDCVECAT